MPNIIPDYHGLNKEVSGGIVVRNNQPKYNLGGEEEGDDDGEEGESRRLWSGTSGQQTMVMFLSLIWSEAPNGVGT